MNVSEKSSRAADSFLAHIGIFSLYFFDLRSVSEKWFHDLNSQNKFTCHKQTKNFKCMQLCAQIILLLRMVEQFM